VESSTFEQEGGGFWLSQKKYLGIGYEIANMLDNLLLSK